MYRPSDISQPEGESEQSKDQSKMRMFRLVMSGSANMCIVCQQAYARNTEAYNHKRIRSPFSHLFSLTQNSKDGEFSAVFGDF